MNGAFKELEPKKQERILNAAFKEFGEQGYENASTNRIVSEAGISKGLLFYYFDSKEGLFDYLTEYGLDFFKKHYLEKLKGISADFIERMTAVGVLKIRLTEENPDLVRFFFRFYGGGEKIFSKKSEAEIGRFAAESYRLMYAEPDTSRFRDDIPKERVMQLIRWSMDGYIRDLTEQVQKQGGKLPGRDTAEEFYQYLGDLKKIFYTIL